VRNRTGGVGINASIIGESPTGLGLYAINLIRALDTLRADLRVYTSSPEALGPLRARILPDAPSPRTGRRRVI
jgi:hypothetical protein